MVARRPGDVFFRRHPEWFGLFAIFFFLLDNALGPVFGAPDPVLTDFLYPLGYFVGSYRLYRSVQSLAPINRLLAE